jgi:hypothetical protein
MLFFGFLLFLSSFEFGYKVLWDIEEERCASHKGPGRSCGGKIRFSPPLLTFAGEAGGRGKVSRDTWITGVD